MKIFAVLLIYIFSIHFSYSQNIGVRINGEFSDLKETNNSIGGGLYLNINNFSKKIEIVLSFDFTKNEKDFSDKNPPINSGVINNFYKLFFSTSPLYVFSINEKIKTKIGPVINYSLINAGEKYYPFNIINSFKSQYIGLGLMSNLQFQKIFKLPLNFDIFISPNYLININYKSNPTDIKSVYSDNSKILNVQLGLSYIIK